MRFRYKLTLLVLIAGLASTGLLAQDVTRGPYLQMQTDDGVTIHWRTDIATESVVRYGNAPDNLLSVETVGGTRTDHAVTLSGLGSSQKFWFSVGDSLGSLAGDSTYHFSTAPVQGAAADTRVWVIGDSGTADANARAVRDAYKTWTGSNPADLWLMLGDNAYQSGTDAEYQSAVFNTYPEVLRQLPLWATLGNHDGANADSTSQSGPYYDIFNFPTGAEIGGWPSYTEAYYSFDYANIHFVCLDSYDTSRASNGTMMNWLRADLAANTQPWVIAFWHHPPYTKGSHNSDTEGRLIDMRQNALPILELNGVDLVLTGHSHSYERSYLLDGHYGVSTTLDPVGHVLDPGDGSDAGDGAYEKPDTIGAAHYGSVYAVAGSSGKISGGALDHPAMFLSLNSLGSLVLDISGNRMDAVFIDQSGAIQDDFTIIKTPDLEAPLIAAVSAGDASHVDVEFNEKLDVLEATNPANFSIAGLTVSQAELVNGDKSVRLTTSVMTPGFIYTVVVNNVEDLAGNVIAVDSETDFEFIEIMTLAFQDGLSPVPGYDGASDGYIREASPDTGYGLAADLQVDGSEPSGSVTDMSMLLRWDIDDIPADAIVEDAHFVLEVTNISPGTYGCYELLAPWDQSQLTWNQALTGVSWGAPGASSGADRGTGLICSVNAGITGPLQVDLTAEGLALVQSWVADPAGNHGIIVANPDTSDGADFHSSESATAMARPRLEVTYRVPVPVGNTDPVSSFTSDCTYLECDFTDTSTDSDGTIGAWAWDFGDGSSSTAQNPSHTYASGGDYTVSLTVTDDDLASHVSADVVSVTAAPDSIDQLAQSDLPAAGTVSGTFLDTHEDDGVVQEITERESGGKKNNRYSYAAHTWQFSVAPGSAVTLFANAWSGGSSDGDEFIFAWSSNNVDFTDLFTVPENDEDIVQSAIINASGTIYIRVADSDQTPGHRSQDTVFVDELYIRTDLAIATEPPDVPQNLQVTGITSSTISLSWQHDGTDELSFDLERSPAEANIWTGIANPGAGSTGHTDTGLDPGTGYDYRIRAGNSAGDSEFSSVASGTTSQAAAISADANDYKVKGVQHVDLTWSGASSGSVDIVRDDEVIESIGSNSGETTDNIGVKGGGSYVYRVCESGTSSCSDDIHIVF